jgi:hypothetical protein
MKQLVENFNLKPDYTASLVQVYQNATLMAIKQLQKLENLYYVDHPLLNDDSGVSEETNLVIKDGFRSWVARWDEQTQYKSFPHADYVIYTHKTDICVS